MSEKLYDLAYKIGVAAEYTDAGLYSANHRVSDDTLKFFSNILGFKAENDSDVEQSLKKFENRRWQRTLDSIYVRNHNHVVFDAIIDNAKTDSDFALFLFNHQTQKEKTFRL